MSLEMEIKVLGIEVEKVRKALKDSGATFIDEIKQYLYTYDVPTISYRFLEIKELLGLDNKLIYDTNIKRFFNLLEEIQQLLKDYEVIELCSKYGITKLTDIVKSKQKVMEFINDEIVMEFFSRYSINPNKWVRLRKSNSKVELTVKHIMRKLSEDEIFQHVDEREIKTNSFEDTNLILESLGLARRNYQEKIRYSYVLGGVNIEIDVWPMIDPYLEIECTDINKIREIISKLGLENNELVSCNTEELYKRIGVDIKSLPELKFES